jgi:hypothetical protein
MPNGQTAAQTTKNGRRRVTTKASEELLAAPLPDLIRDLGLAVATANQALSQSGSNSLIYTIPSAEIEVNIAISINKGTTAEVKAGANISAFSVNASYARTYGYKEEASSRLKITLAAKPVGEET